MLTEHAEKSNTDYASTSATLRLLNQGVMLQWSASARVWYVQSDDLPLSQLDGRYVQQSSLPLSASSPSNNQVLAYNSSAGKWENQTASGGTGGAWFVVASGDTTGSTDVTNLQNALIAARTADAGWHQMPLFNRRAVLTAQSR